MRSFLCACLALLLCGLVALAAEKAGMITDVRDVDKLKEGKTTVIFQQYNKKEKVGEPGYLPVSKDVKVVRVSYAGRAKGESIYKPIEGGLENERFSKENLAKGVRVRLVTEGEGEKETIIQICPYGVKEDPTLRD